MADILLFIQDGWKTIWKQKIIWLFSALAVLQQIFATIQTKGLSPWPWLFLSLAQFLSLVLYFVSIIAVPYLAYSFTIGRTVNVQETLSAVRKFAWRVIGCCCLGALILIPCLFLAVRFPIYISNQPLQSSDKVLLIMLPLSIINAMPNFALFGFFANDWGIRQSLKNALSLFTAHFGVLVMLGIIMAIIFRAYSIASGVLTVLIQSNLGIVSLSKLNYFNPSASLSSNMLFILLSGICQTIYIPFNSSILALAYLKYSSQNHLNIARQNLERNHEVYHEQQAKP